MSSANVPPPITQDLVAQYLCNGPLRSVPADAVRLEELMGGARHHSIVARWVGEPLAGFNAIVVRIIRHDTPRAREEFQREAQALTAASGTLGPKLIAAEDENPLFGRPLMLLEFIEGESRSLHDVSPAALVALGASVG